MSNIEAMIWDLLTLRALQDAVIAVFILWFASFLIGVPSNPAAYSFASINLLELLLAVGYWMLAAVFFVFVVGLIDKVRVHKFLGIKYLIMAIFTLIFSLLWFVLWYYGYTGPYPDQILAYAWTFMWVFIFGYFLGA